MSDMESVAAVASRSSDGWTSDGCSGRDGEIVILCFQHFEGAVLERVVSQRHCIDQSFPLLI